MQAYEFGRSLDFSIKNDNNTQAILTYNSPILRTWNKRGRPTAAPLEHHRHCSKLVDIVRWTQVKLFVLSSWSSAATIFVDSVNL